MDDLARIAAILDLAHPTAIERTNRAGSSLNRELTLPERVQRLVAERDLAREAERLLRDSHKETVARAQRLSTELELLTGVAR